MVIDSHVHVFDRSVPGARDNFPLWPGNAWGGGGSNLIQQMDEAGIDRSVLISYTPTDVMAHYHPDQRDQKLAVFQHYLSREYAVQTWREFPDRLYWFADSIDPRVPGYVERSARDLDEGAAGLKLLPLFVDTEMGDPSWRPIFELLQERNRPCIIDLSWWYAQNPWFAPSVYDKFDSFTEYVQGLRELVSDFPDVRIQLAHYGTPRLRESGFPELRYELLEEPIDLIRTFPNITCDLAAYQHVIEEGEPFPYWSALKILEILVQGLDITKIHWGTDWPYLGRQAYPELIRAIREVAFLKPGEADLILGLNFKKWIE